MAMEKGNYRLNLEAVIAAFPDEPLPAISAVCSFIKKDIRTMNKDKVFTGMIREVGERKHMTRESLAHWLSGGK